MQPLPVCPAGLDVGLINKYYDLARAGMPWRGTTMQTWGTTAAACIGCGHCDARCPFQVKQVRRMEEIAAYFGGLAARWAPLPPQKAKIPGGAKVR